MTQTSREGEFKRICEELFELWSAKDKCYGPSNLQTFGELGILIRSFDKVMRLKSLVWDKNDNTLMDETIEDTWRDLAVYSIRALMVRNGGDAVTNSDFLKTSVELCMEIATDNRCCGCDKDFVTEACRLWRVIYGNEIAFTLVTEYFASKAPSPKSLRNIAENAVRLADRLNELADELEQHE